MSQPDHELILEQIRAAGIEASPALRARVRAIAASTPPEVPRRALPWRRLVLVAVPACLAVAAAVSFSAGVLDSGKSGPNQAAHRAERAASPPSQSDTLAPDTLKSAGGGAAGLPATSGRAQRYE